MNIEAFLPMLVISTVTLVLLDMAYIRLIAQFTIGKTIETIQGSAVNLQIPNAIMAYGVMVFGLMYFVLRTHQTPITAGVLGLVIYGTYNLTNAATFKDWSVSWIDIIWGFALFWLTTRITYYVIGK